MDTIRTTSSRKSRIDRCHLGRPESIAHRRIVVCIVILLLILGGGESYAQGVGISEISITPAASSILELRSTLRGFLPPRLTTAERDAISLPATGLFLYNTTTSRFNFYNGAWIPLTATSDNLSAFSSTTSAQLAGVISDETGTGLAVFATSPVLTTPTLGVATGTSLALGGGTALTTTNQTGTGSLVLATSPTVTTPTLTSPTLAAGTASAASMNFTSGTNLTTAAAGAAEYDGKVFYNTAVASTRQVTTTQQFISNTADFTMANVATAQSVFAAGNDVITVDASTSYFFEATYYITGMGATTRTTATLFGGTATFTSIRYFAMIQRGAANALGMAQSTKSCVTATANILDATVATAAAVITLKGIIRISAAGTIIPQIQFSANPTGTILGMTDSWFRIWPIGTNTVAAVGNVN